MCSKGDCVDKVQQALECNDVLRSIYHKFDAQAGVAFITSNRSEQYAVPIRCEVCADTGIESKAAAYIKVDPIEIVICTNRLNERKIERALLHESVHLFDYVNGRVDFSDCDGLAHSEIRAAREGECRHLNFRLQQFTERHPLKLLLLSPIGKPLQWMQESCVRAKAIQSTANLFPDGAGDCVARNFSIAMRDLEPQRQQHRGPASDIDKN